MLLACTVHFPVYAQRDIYYYEWDANTLHLANTAAHVDYLSQQEKKLIYYTNLARMNPPLFAKTYLKAYIKEHNIKKNKWYWSLVKDMAAMAPMEPLYPERDLCDFAKAHAKDMGLSGKKGHRSTQGEFYADRTQTLRKKYTYVRENCHYGYAESLAIICDLLIDEDVKSLSHRKIILKPDLKYIGVAIYSHKKYQFNCVMEYAGEKIQKEYPMGQIEN